jgi:sec-independent protein translocase protein TatC
VRRQPNEDLFEHTKMTFGEHLEELRWSLIKALAALTVGFLIGLYPPISAGLVAYIQTPLRESLKEYYLKKDFNAELLRLEAAGLPVPKSAEEKEAALEVFRNSNLTVEERLVDRRDLQAWYAQQFPDAGVSAPPRDPSAAPKRDDLVRLRFYYDIDNDPRLAVIGLRMEEPFVVYVKAALVLGIVLSSPFVFYFIWQFVAAGLYSHERRYVHVFLPFSLALFLAGAALAYFVAIHYVLKFMLWFYEMMAIDPDPRISDWLSFVMILPLGFGVSFQLPLVMLFLERIGIFTVATYKSHWRVSVLVIAFLSMILTPSDPQSMLLMAVPLTILYFGGILLCQWMPRRTTPFGDVIG